MFDKIRNLPWGVILLLAIFLVAMAAIQNLLFAGIVLLAVVSIELMVEHEMKAGRIDERSAWLYRIIGLSLLFVFAGLVQKKIIPLTVTGDDLVDTAITALIASVVSTTVALGINYLAKRNPKISSRSTWFSDNEWLESIKRDE
ncbi:MAG: hypothetical protein JHC26_07415 [Thermofilum sp.]|jgi:hypothetical protein|uniref:hypothetical protein n=1 Tax=Thermofilum sp. TaxID=1961369 RepID=UPI002582792C|nr:hypothetical protein [Thermofilum sp.]MCI4408905.1 hypothetical protein [Thermofilum sp.]